MSDTTNIRIQDAFVTINFKDLERFSELLGLDEVVFFQYLVFKCSSNAGEWWQSARSIETKLKIKCTRLSSIVSRFETLKVLSSETKGFRNNTHYSLNFEELAKPERLQDIYNWPLLSKEEQKTVLATFKVLAKAQQAGKQPKGKPDAEPITTKTTVKQTDVDAVARLFVYRFEERRKMYNDQKVGRQLSHFPLVVYPKHRKQISKALAYLNDSNTRGYIDGAFTAFCDEINNISGGTSQNNDVLTERPKTDLLGYFLSSKNGFDTINTFATIYAGYGSERG